MSEGTLDTINANTRYCAVFGHPIRHSASPAMQNAGLAALNLDWRYLACEVYPDQLRSAIEGAKVMGFIGLNLTVPHKLLAVDLVDFLDPRARELGAVNTIVFEAKNSDGQWLPINRAAGSVLDVRSHGYNTDADAIIQSLTEDFAWPDLRGARVLILGAGGAARSAALRLAEAGVSSLHIVNRTVLNAVQLAETIATRFPGTKVLLGYPTHTVDLVLNATSLGLKVEDPLPIDLKWLQTHRPPRVYDMIYRPRETALLQAARAAGCRVANGLGMLLHQGAEALRLWTGSPPPVAVMRAALERNVHG